MKKVDYLRIGAYFVSITMQEHFECYFVYLMKLDAIDKTNIM